MRKPQHASMCANQYHQHDDFQTFEERCYFRGSIISFRGVILAELVVCAGITLACGTGACATLVNAVRRGLIGKEQVRLITITHNTDILAIQCAHAGMTSKVFVYLE